MMNERNVQILHGLVEEYIRTGFAVGSDHLVEMLNLRASPATVRNVFRKLEEEGYIEQPHISAGRIPTDTGYRYYVDHLEDPKLGKSEVNKVRNRMVTYREKYEHPARATAKVLSDFSHLFAIAGWMQAGVISESGLSGLIDNEHDEAQLTVKEVSVIMDNIDSYIEQFSDMMTSDVEVFIGKENPVYEALYTSVLLRSVETDEQEDGILMLIGPKRMHYRQNVAILDNVAFVVEQE